MKRLLLLTSGFPPAVNAETPALLAACRYLPTSGWEPVVMAMPPSRPLHSDETLLREIPSRVKVFRGPGSPGATALPAVLSDLLRAPDPLARNHKAIVNAGLEIIRRERPTLIMPLMPSHSLGQVSVELSHKTGLPMIPFFAGLWLADYSAVWTSGVQRLLHGFLEKRIVKSASALVTGSEGAAGWFMERYPGFCPPVHVAHNSFDPDRTSPAPPVEKGGALRIGWVDSFRGTHTPETVLSGVGEFFRRNPDTALQVEHAGLMPDTSRTHKNISFNGMPPWRSMPGFMSSCHVLLLSLPVGINSHRECPAVAADSLRTGRPIVAATPEGDMSQTLRSLGGAYICQPDPMALASTLEDVHDHWRKGILRAPRDQMKISEQLSGAVTMKNLAGFIDGFRG
ncbi:MAG: hypothetical protein R6V62_05460 [Candidatus Fermentibacteraceae bacterium]